MPEHQTILLTGANGFTGCHFSRIASAAGHTVVPLQADLCDPGGLTRELAVVDFDAVVHLAGIAFVGHADALGFYQVNVLGTLNLLDAILKSRNPKAKVLVASSANIYGNAAISPISESALPSPVNHYATSKLAMECMATTYKDRLNLIVARPFNYTGPGQNPDFLIPKLVHHYKARSTSISLGNLDVEREFNDVRMVVEAYLGLLAHGTSGETYNVCSGQTHTLQSILTLLSELTGHQPEIEVDPRFVRANEIQKLSGSPKKLLEQVSNLKPPTIRETLEWMLEA